MEWNKRYLCGPRIVRELTGKVQAALLGRPNGWLNRPDGVELLLKFLQKVVLKAAIPDLGHPMDEFFFRLKLSCLSLAT